MKGTTFVSMTISVDSKNTDAKVDVEGIVVVEGKPKNLKKVLSNKVAQAVCGNFLKMRQKPNHIAPCMAFALACYVAKKCEISHDPIVVPYREIVASVVGAGWHQQFLCTLIE